MNNDNENNVSPLNKQSGCFFLLIIVISFSLIMPFIMIEIFNFLMEKSIIKISFFYYVLFWLSSVIVMIFVILKNNKQSRKINKN